MEVPLQSEGHDTLSRLGVTLPSLFLLIMLCLPCVATAVTVSDGFNYPVGSRNPGVVNEEGPRASDFDGWFNAQDFRDENVEFGGLHAGEDWNDDCGGQSDVGAPVYAISHGEVVGSRNVLNRTGESVGDALVLKHVLPAGSVYSLYLHIDVVDGLRGDVVRDQPIGTIADIEGAHLHFELRTEPIDVEGTLWPSDKDSKSHNAYYGTGGTAEDESRTPEEKMTADGLTHDPSDFMDANRPPTSALQRGRIPHSFRFEWPLGLEDVCRYEVRYLQQVLNSDPDTRVSQSGLGSPGNETSEFGPLTEDAVKRFQAKYVPLSEGTGSVDAPTRTQLNAILAGARQNPNVDVALILDSSGSMFSNDPDNKRLDAARAYLTGAFVGDFVGIVDFDSNVRLASPLRRLPDSKDLLIDAINTIDSSGGTNIGLGVQEACDALVTSPSQHLFTKGAILLTDGFGSFSGQDECFVRNGWPIYTFGLGSGADNALLQRIASDTGGEHAALPASELICAFQRVRSKIAGVAPPPCEVLHIFPLEVTTFFVSVEPGQLQATFSVQWIGSDIVTTLRTPSGRVIDRSTVAPDVSHDLGATFEIYAVADPEPGEWQVELFGADIPPGGEEATFGFSTVPASVTIVDIDIKPGSDPNSVAPRRRGVVPVAILTTDDFDATKVDPMTVAFGPNGAKEAHRRGHVGDVDSDGDTDLVLHFRTQETGIACGDTSALLTGETLDGQAFEGMDSVRTVGCQRGRRGRP